MNGTKWSQLKGIKWSYMIKIGSDSLHVPKIYWPNGTQHEHPQVVKPPSVKNLVFWRLFPEAFNFQVMGSNSWILLNILCFAPSWCPWYIYIYIHTHVLIYDIFIQILYNPFTYPMISHAIPTSTASPSCPSRFQRQRRRLRLAMGISPRGILWMVRGITRGQPGYNQGTTGVKPGYNRGITRV